MLNHTKIVIALTLLTFGLLFSTTSTKAQIPTNTGIDCENVSDTEFHSLRPYQMNTECTSQTANMATFCGNELTIKETITQTYPGGGGVCTSAGGKIKCTYDISIPSHLITIDLSGANLPIMGNTEDVINYQNTSDTLSDADKMNEYVSWYLGGVTTNKEYPDKNDVTNYSGPIAKLLPQQMMEKAKIESIENATGKTLNSGQSNVKQNQHDEIVVCANISTGQLEKCDQFNRHRLSFWSGKFIFNQLESVVIDLFAKMAPSLGNVKVKEFLEKQEPWKYRYPPLPWNPEFKDDPLLYRKAYKEWRGDICIIVPILNSLVCVNNPLTPDSVAKLFAYIQPSSTEDVPGYISVDSVSSATSPGVGGTTIKNVRFSNQTPSELFFSHMQEGSQLGSLLQDTYTPQGQDKVGNPTNVSSDISCNDVEVRSNKGDDLFATQLTGNLSYNASFTCEFDPASSSFSSPVCSSMKGKCVPGDWSCTSTYGGMDCGSGFRCGVGCTAPSQTCKKDVYIRLSTQSSIPMADDIWSRLVAGPMAVFKRIFPKTNTEGGMGQIMDIPGSTNITFSGSGVSQSNTDLKIPHIGGVSEYFLKGIQTALRPKGFGEPISFANPSIANVPAGVCDGTVFSKYNPSSQTTSTANNYFTSYILPKLTNDLVAVYKEAERQTGVPCEVLAGVHFEEGSSDPNKSLQNGGSLNGRSLLDSAIQAGHEIAAKVGGSINSREDLITALSYYNGGGNSNCGKNSEYKGPCPPPSGIDDPYVTSYIDASHLTMKLIYCWDFTQCPLPYPDFQRPGVLTVATELYNSKK